MTISGIDFDLKDKEDVVVDVSIMKIGSGVRPGFDSNYYIFYENLSNITVPVVIKDILPEEIEYKESLPPGIYEANSVRWNMDIKPKERGYITIVVRVKNGVEIGREIKNRVKIETPFSDRDLGNNEYINYQTVVGAIDPNDKFGPEFVSQIRDNGWINYIIKFENLATATLPARYITIEDKLDERLNWDTLEIMNIGIGTRSFYLGTFSFETILGTISFKLNNGVITWNLEGEDFLLPPNETGFLPPNKNPPEGEGYVCFRVKVKDNISSGGIIKNKASIRFDFQDEIETRETQTILDTTSPIVNLLLPSYTTSNIFPVSWSSIDAIGTISEYSIYVEEANKGFNCWIGGTSSTSSLYTGEYGKEYRLYVLAKDRAGNTGTSQLATTRVLSEEFEDSLNNVLVFPNPCLVYKGQRRITFTNLTKEATIRIFNIKEEMIERLEENDGDGRYEWEIPKNLASGIYIYLITNDKGDKKIGKIGIIK